MTRRRRIWVAAIIFAAVGVSACFALLQHERLYGGKPISFWFGVMQDTSPGFDPPPVWQDLGADETAVLIKALQLRESPIQKMYMLGFMAKVPRSVQSRLPKPLDTDGIAMNALLFLDVRNPRHENAVLSRLAVPALIHMMKTDRSYALRGMAASVLGSIGEVNAETRIALTEALKDPAPMVQLQVRQALHTFDLQLGRKVDGK